MAAGPVVGAGAGSSQLNGSTAGKRPSRWDRLGRLIRPSLIDRVERDHRQTDDAFRRRRVVSLITLVVGATLLGLGLAVTPGAAMFYVLTFALAATWVIGSFVSGPLHLGRIATGSRLRRPVVAPILIGLVIAAVFVVGALVARDIPVLRDYAENVLAFARYGSLPLVAVVTLVNGIAEEIFFRGALFAAIGVNHPVLISSVIYGVVTLASGNPMLVFAAGTLGVVLGLQRRASGGILAPIITHVTWSTAMLFLLPPVFAG